MNFEISLKTQNVRSFDLSETGLSSMKTKIKATMFEGDNILCLKNTQIGRNRHIIEKDFFIGGKYSIQNFYQLWRKEYPRCLNCHQNSSKYPSGGHSQGR